MACGFSTLAVLGFPGFGVFGSRVVGLLGQ